MSKRIEVFGRKIGVVACCLAVFGSSANCAPGAEAAVEATVEGALERGGEAVPLPYGYAVDKAPWHAVEQSWSLQFTAEPLEEAQIGSNTHELPFVEIMLSGPRALPLEGRHAMGSELSVAQNVKLSSDGYLKAGGARPEVEISEAGNGKIAGRVWLEAPVGEGEDAYRYDVSFSLPTTRQKRPGLSVPKPLPEGGGEPGEAYRDLLSALASGHQERVLSALPEAMRSELQSEVDGLDSDQFRELIELYVLSGDPAEAEVLGGVSDGDVALLELRDPADGDRRGLARMTRSGGGWALDDSSWN